MAARHCSVDLILLPPNYMKCPLCDGDTQYRPHNMPDSDWVERVNRAQQEEAQRSSGEALWPTVEATVIEDGGQLWVSAWDVFSALGHRLVAGALITVGGQVYEVLGYQEPARRYWVRPFQTEVTEEGLQAWLGD